MKKLFAITYLLLSFCLVPNLFAQTDFVKVVPLSKYDFKISNTSSFNFQVQIKGHDYPISSGKMQPFKTKNIDESTTMQLIYSKPEYNRVKNVVIRELAKYFVFDKIREVVNEYVKEIQEERKSSLKDVLTRKFSDFVFEYWLEQEIDRLQDILKTNESLYAASRGAQNDYSSNFHKTYIYSYATAGTIGKRGLTPVVNAVWDFPTKKHDLGDYWDRRSSDFSSNVTVSIRLSPELKWGNKNTFTSLHGFVSLYRPSYGLKTGNRTFYVGEEYIEGDASPLTELRTGQNINLNLNQISGGIFIRNFFYPKLFLDIGAGYTFANTARLHFDPQGDNKTTINHLPNSINFDEKKPKDVAIVQQKELYGMAQVGIYLTNFGYKNPAAGFFLIGGCKVGYQPIIEIGDNYELYNTNNETGNGISPVKVPIMETAQVNQQLEQKPKISLKFGFGISF
ncbi:MAG: hypothetical protein R3E32_15800 [Chitinophagales bacterium]